MHIIEQKFSGPADLDEMAELVREFPAENLHSVDLPYRFSSWALDYPENIRLWRDEKGRLTAWAILQTPFWTIDYAFRNDMAKDFHQPILSWADDKAGEIVETPSGHPAWFVTVLASQVDRIRDLEQAGFASQANVGENSWSQVLMEHSMHIPNDMKLPNNFRIRPLAGAQEVKAYVELHRAVFDAGGRTGSESLRRIASGSIREQKHDIRMAEPNSGASGIPG